MLHQKSKIVNKRRISQSEIRNSAAAESEGGQKFIPTNPMYFCPPERQVSFLPREARQSVGISFKMSSDFFQQTPPKFIYSGICLARGFAPRFGGHFGKIIPRIFEINRQFSRRKAAVHKLLSLYCGKSRNEPMVFFRPPAGGRNTK